MSFYTVISILSRLFRKYQSGISEIYRRLKAEIGQREAIELAILFVIALVQLAIHFGLSRTVREELVFRYSDPTILSAWTAAFVHGSNRHLFGNVFTYIAAIGLLYYLFYLWNRRRVFWGVFAVLLVGTPLLTSFVDYQLLYLRWGVLTPDADSKGFSGIASALGGMALAAVGLFLRDEYSGLFGYAVSMLIFLIGLFAISVNIGSFNFFLAVLFIIAFAGILLLLMKQTGVRNFSDVRVSIRENDALAELVVYTAVLIILIMYVAIPDEITQGGSFINVIAHMVGFGFGAITLLIVYGLIIRYQRSSQ